GQGQTEQAAALLADVDVAPAGRAADNAAERLRQFVELAARVVEIGAFAQADFDAVAAHLQAGIADAGVTQHAAHVVTERLELFAAHRIGVDRKQDVRATLQVEAEHDVALRPFRPALHGLFGEEVRYREQAHDERRQQNPERPPPREI